MLDGRAKGFSAMKIQFRSILFALVLPVAACGGDKSQMVDGSPIDYMPKMTVSSQPSVSEPTMLEAHPIAELVQPSIKTEGDKLEELKAAAIPHRRAPMRRSSSRACTSR